MPAINYYRVDRKIRPPYKRRSERSYNSDHIISIYVDYIKSSILLISSQNVDLSTLSRDISGTTV